MDAGIVDSINRRDAALIADKVAILDDLWYEGQLAAAFLSSQNADRAWLLGQMAPGIPGLRFDGAPADCDWDNLFSHIRAEILARRDPQSPLARAAIAERDGVGSR